MATTSNTYTGNGSNKLFSITFPYLDESDIDVYLNGTLQTITTQYIFANATTIEFVTAPSNGAVVLLDRSTDDVALQATFFTGSTIRSSDLNSNFDQVLFIAQESTNDATAALAASTAATVTANSAASVAGTASTNASNALSTANSAITTANNALSTANTASTNASNALSTANNAITAANNAVTTANQALPLSGGTITGVLEIGNTGSLVFEGSINDGFETTLAVTEPTADNIVTLPNVTGTVITTGDTGSVTSAMILDGTILNADINASAAIAGSKIVAATTSVVGAVQLEDSTSSTSTTKAATPASVKLAYDLADLAGTVAAGSLPKAGGTMTGNVILDNQVDARFREATANGTNYVGFQAPAAIPADLTWTLPAADGSNGQVLSTDGAGTLSWIVAPTPAPGPSTPNVIVETQQTISQDFTITVGYNGLSVGPVAVAATYTVTVPSNATWIVV